jgi:Lrp/AsnC family leucine-responsive transcriptional regulator
MESISIDTNDWKLLDLLQNDASRTNQALAAAVGISPATCLRRVKRLTETGLIRRQVALLDADRLAALAGHGLTAIVEVTLERQDDARISAFATRVAADTAVQQCYRVSPGPDLVLIARVRDMPEYAALAKRLFTAELEVRTVRAFFSVAQLKYETNIPIALNL